MARLPREVCLVPGQGADQVLRPPFPWQARPRHRKSATAYRDSASFRAMAPAPAVTIRASRGAPAESRFRRNLELPPPHHQNSESLSPLRDKTAR
jgi:hypothetical protein